LPYQSQETRTRRSTSPQCGRFGKRSGVEQFAEPPHTDKTKEEVASSPSPLSRKDILVTVIVILTVLLWATESWNTIQTIYVGLMSVLALHFPYMGPCYIADRNANMRLSIFVIAIMALSASFSQPETADVQSVLNTYISKFIGLGSNKFERYYLTYLFSTVLVWIVSTGPAAGIIVPQLIKIAQTNPEFGLDPFLIGLCPLIGGCSLIYPSQSSPTNIAFQLGRVDKGDFVKILVCNTVFTFVLLAPLTIGYWLVLGTPNS